MLLIGNKCGNETSRGFALTYRVNALDCTERLWIVYCYSMTKADAFVW